MIHKLAYVDTQNLGNSATSRLITSRCRKHTSDDSLLANYDGAVGKLYCLECWPVDERTPEATAPSKTREAENTPEFCPVHKGAWGWCCAGTPEHWRALKAGDRESRIAFLERKREATKADLLLKFEDGDHHGVADAAMDLRDIESELKGLRFQ